MMPDYRLARRMALERMPSRYVGAEVTMRHAVNCDALLFRAAGMPMDEAVLVSALELLHAQMASVEPAAGPSEKASIK